MDSKFFIENSNGNIYLNENEKNNNFFSPIQDNIVNDFVNKNISLETIIETEMFKNIL